MSLSKHKSIKDDQLPPPDGKINVTILASEWGSSKGGLSTLNRELAIQLAKFPELQISFFVPNCSERDKIAALSHSIKIVQATRRPGYDELEWLSFPPDQLQIDVIVGHGVKLGRQAQFIRNSHKCKWIQVVHTVPEELGMFKTYQNPISTGEKKRKTEVELCEMADVVIGVGPKSCEAFRRYLRYCEKDKNILKITPGVFDEFLNIEHVDKDLKRCGILVFGRGDAEDFELKGFDIAGKAVAEVEEARLTFVGAPEGKHKDIAKRFLKCGVPADRLTIRSFLEDRESLKHLFCEMDLVLMPSRTEKFGLTGLEALSAGLPVLVSRNSGFGEALSEVPFGESYVIDSEDSKVWADEIKKVWRKNRKERLQEVELLRSSYGKVFSWATQSKVFVNKMKDIFHVPHEIKGQGLRAKQAYENALRIGKVPHEIKGQGLRAKQAYENALRIGKVKVYRARIMLIGQDRAGKTSLKKSLLGLPFDAEEQSTVGIEVDLSSFKVDVDQITNWQRTAKKEGVSQFAKELARIVAGDLKNEEAKMDLTPQSELKETRSHKTQGGELHIPNTEFATIDLSRNESHKTKEHNTLASHHSAPKTPHSKSKSSSHHMGKSKHHESQLRIDASTPPEEFTEYLIQYLKGLNLQSDCSPTEPVVDVDVWDLAGQYLYYASHPVFFSFRALYLLVCNLSKGLNKTAEPYVRQGIHDIRLENPNGETNLENLLSWLVSVDAISPTQQEAGEKEPPYVRPPVLMVGTHADKPFQDIEEMNIQIRKELSGKDFGRHVITQFFSIDNTQSSSNAGVIKLREEIRKVLEKEPYMGEEVPVRWFNFEKVVQALNGNHTFYLNVKDLQAIVKEVCFVKDETELGVMLDFYHDLGVVVKHGSTVVLHAPWLIDLFKQLITIPRYEEVGLESRLIKHWKYLEETGILCMELVRHVFSKFIKENSVAEKDILDMMERFGLVAKFVRSKQEPVQYFVPAQLKALPKDLCEMETSEFDPCPLYLDFFNGFVPHGVFYHLVARCIGWCSENGFRRPPTLYNRAARFFILKKSIHQFILLCRTRYIKIILKHRKPVSEAGLAEGAEVAEDLRNFLGRTLEDMSQQIPWRGNLKYELCVECPFCPTERKSCQNHGKISCTHEDCLCLLKMAPVERLLCEKCLCDEEASFPGLEKWFLRVRSKYDVASTSQVEPVQDCHHLERLKVTLLGEEWTSQGGGLSTFNRELAKHLAKVKHSEVEVTLLVPEGACTQKDKNDAWGNGVRVMEAKKCVYYKPADWLISPPEDFNADVVFGHGRIFGPQVQILKRPPYNCKWIQVVHTDPEELAKYKGYDCPISEGERKRDTEIALCKIANLVVPVGPKLCEKYSSYLASKPDGNIVPLTPGLFEEFGDLPDLNKDPEGRSEFKVLLCGRGDPEDFELKGYDIAAQAFAGGELRETRCSLLFVGVRDGEQDEKTKLLLSYGIDKKQLYVRRFVGSRAKMKDLLCEADLAIMPSRAEGFGLIALEALSACLPILVSGNSGFAQAIRDLPNGKLFIVDSEKPEEWATAIAAVEKRHREYVQKIKELREAYGEKYSWEEQCETLVNKMRKMVQGVN